MDTAQLAGQDLNLLVALHALLHERHVSRAAARLGMSQPAMSRALGRLRDMFDDPLLVRASSGMQPTARALELYPKVVEILAGVREIVRPTHFDPQTTSSSVRVAAPSVIAYMMVPPLLRSLAVAAPGLELAVLDEPLDWRERLADGAIDLCVTLARTDTANLYSCPLIESGWACVLRRDHPALREKWTAECFAALDHVVDSFSERGARQIDAALAEHKLERRITVYVAYPTLTPLLVAETDLVLTTSRWLARKLNLQLGLVVRRPPIAIAPACAPLVWHERSHRDPMHRWLRELFVRVAKDL